jgi:UDP-N-acetylglucosamine acyltransferase
LPRKNFRPRRNINIHPSAVVSPEAELAAGVEIGPYTVIGADVKIGSNVSIGASVHIDGWTRIGADNRIYNGCSIGLPPQHLDYDGEKTHVFIGDGNCFREFVTVHRGTVDGGGETRIGNGNYFKSYSHIAHDCILSNNITLGNCTNLSGHVVIENDATLESIVGVHQFVHIGELARVNTHSKVVKDIPPYIEASGHPAQVVGVNFSDLRKKKVDESLKQEIVKAYKILYDSGLSTEKALIKMDQVLKTSEEIEHFIRFIRSSTRGICR